jgi:hypothetical protein
VGAVADVSAAAFGACDLHLCITVHVRGAT